MFERRRSAGKIVQLPVEDIHPSPYQARTTFDEQELAGLAQSIRENGLLQPTQAYDLNHFPALRDRYQVMSVPCLVVNHGQQVVFGKKSLPQLLDLLAP